MSNVKNLHDFSLRDQAIVLIIKQAVENGFALSIHDTLIDTITEMSEFLTSKGISFVPVTEL